MAGLKELEDARKYKDHAKWLALVSEEAKKAEKKKDE